MSLNRMMLRGIGLSTLLLAGLVLLATIPTSQAETMEFTNSIGQKFVLIPAGTFMMGSPSNEPEHKINETQHRVTISRAFYMQTTEVTQGQWKAVMGDNPAKFIDRGPDGPVEMVSWDDVREFIARLNTMEAGAHYRLPTEAEWEYACRAGSQRAYFFGDAVSDSEKYAWSYENSDGRTHRVGSKRPNAWGLYDMAGNVWEWCQDWYGDYPTGSVTDPGGSLDGEVRVYRGGSWGYYKVFCRSAVRNGDEPGNRGDQLGFRLVRTIIRDQ